MKTRRRDFPGTDPETSKRLASDVAFDEDAIMNALIELRETNTMSLEAIGFLLGSDPSQISRYLRGSSKVTLTDYVRIARAFGYRSRIVFEQAEPEGTGDAALSNLKISAHKVCSTRRTPNI